MWRENGNPTLPKLPEGWQNPFCMSMMSNVGDVFNNALFVFVKFENRRGEAWLEYILLQRKPNQPTNQHMIKYLNTPPTFRLI